MISQAIVWRLLAVIVILALVIGGAAPFLTSMSPAVAQEEEEEEVEVEEEVPPGPSRFSHRYLNVSPVQTYPNQPVTISMVVANTGESRGSVQINLTINGTIEQSKRITIDSGSSKRLEFTVMKSDAGTYDFYVGRLHGQFHIIATAAFVPPPPPPSAPTAIPDTTGQLGTGGIIAIVIIGIIVIGGLVVAFMMTRRT